MQPRHRCNRPFGRGHGNALIGARPMIDRILTPAVIDEIRAHGPLKDLRVLPIALALDPPEGVDVERLCIDLLLHPDPWVRGNAAQALGHLARLLRTLKQEGRIRRALKALLHDEDVLVCGRAADAISDMEIFLGWHFDQRDPEPRPRVPRSVATTACYRLYLLFDEESHILVERGAAQEDGFAPDPRGLAHGFEWRLPGFSLTEALSPATQALEDLWALRYPATWANEANRFENVALVRATLANSDRVHRYHDWVELRARAYFVTSRTDAGYSPAPGVEHRWLSPQAFMSEERVGAHDRYMLALFNDYALQNMGSGGALI